MTFIAFLLAAILAIFIHEWGHYRAAIHYRVKVFSLNVGLGPIILRRQGKYAPWNLRLFPLGGYVDMSIADTRRLTHGKRMVISAAGPAINLIPFIPLGFLVIGFTKTMGLLGTAIYMTVVETGRFLLNTIDFFNIIPDPAKKEIGGIIATFDVVNTQMGDFPVLGVFFLVFAAFSIGIAIFNLIPLVPLDGGHILMEVIDRYSTHNTTKRITKIMEYTGTIIVLWLVIALNAKDVIDLFR